MMIVFLIEKSEECGSGVLINCVFLWIYSDLKCMYGFVRWIVVRIIMVLVV